MKTTLIIVLQTVLVIISVFVLILMIRFPLIEGRAVNLDLFSIYTDPFIVYGYIASILFFFVLFKVYRILTYIRQNKTYSKSVINALRSIKFCSILLSLLIGAAGVYLKLYHHKDDDPSGFLTLCIFTAFSLILVSNTAAVLQNAVQKGIYIKSENDFSG